MNLQSKLSHIRHTTSFIRTSFDASSNKCKLMHFHLSFLLLLSHQWFNTNAQLKRCDAPQLSKFHHRFPAHSCSFLSFFKIYIYYFFFLHVDLSSILPSYHYFHAFFFIPFLMQSATNPVQRPKIAALESGPGPKCVSIFHIFMYQDCFLAISNVDAPSPKKKKN